MNFNHHNALSLGTKTMTIAGEGVLIGTPKFSDTRCAYVTEIDAYVDGTRHFLVNGIGDTRETAFNDAIKNLFALYTRTMSRGEDTQEGWISNLRGWFIRNVQITNSNKPKFSDGMTIIDNRVLAFPSKTVLEMW